MQYWRISGPRVDLGAKRPYEPHRAEERVGENARHFAWLVSDLLQAYNKETGRFGVISAAYDTELFGHWWFEGVAWLKEVLRELAKSETVTTTTATRIVTEHGPDRVLSLPESSWGSGGNHSTWLNPETQFMWPVIHEAERTMEELVAAYPAAAGDDLRLLSQITRELLLLESSDWPFLVTTGQAKEYAIERFRDHVARFDQLVAMLRQGAPLTGEQALFLSSLEERDNPFPDVDYRVFAARQGSAVDA
jgi:1,4-alpha-glucan branching enzyme